MPKGTAAKIDDWIRDKLSTVFAGTTAVGLGFFQFYAGFHAIPHILDWWHIPATAPWVNVVSWILGVFCLAITIPAAMGFFLQFSKRDMRDFLVSKQFYKDGTKPSIFENALFNFILPIIPTACTTYMIFKSLQTFPLLLKLFHTIPNISAGTVNGLSIAVASIVSIACFYLLFKVFMAFSNSFRSWLGSLGGSKHGDQSVRVFSDMSKRQEFKPTKGWRLNANPIGLQSVSATATAADSEQLQTNGATS